MLFKINKPFESERKISQSVIQVTELLGMYNAELARILGMQCGDIGELTSGQRCIKQDSDAWLQAKLFIETYHLLFDYFDGDSVAMYHWMRADNKCLNGTPHFLIVDEGKLQIIHDYLYQAGLSKTDA
ncbi:MAG: DUF2384 domain-containing protein [Gammaproteobacteria bacterium]|nr:DUF2384 domain-containing protein [Gammaproteobacteria bacterium]